MNKSLHYANVAPILLTNGYEAIPIIPGTKRPPMGKWTERNFLETSVVGHYALKHPKYGVGVKTGELVVIDLDIPDYELADEFENLCLSRLGHAPIRFGNTPKRALFYKLDSGQFIKKMTTRHRVGGKKYQVEILGAGQQSVVFRVHPDTQASYYWLDDSLLDIPLNELPVTTADKMLSLRDVFETRLSAKFGNGQSLTWQLNPKPAMSKKVPSANCDRVIDALGYLDPQEYETWIGVGYALKSAGRADALSVFQDWSKKRPDGSIPANYVSPEDVAGQFAKFKPDRTSINAIFSRASNKG